MARREDSAEDVAVQDHVPGKAGSSTIDRTSEEEDGRTADLVLGQVQVPDQRQVVIVEAAPSPDERAMVGQRQGADGIFVPADHHTSRAVAVRAVDRDTVDPELAVRWEDPVGKQVKRGDGRFAQVAVRYVEGGSGVAVQLVAGMAVLPSDHIPHEVVSPLTLPDEQDPAPRSARPAGGEDRASRAIAGVERWDSNRFSDAGLASHVQADLVLAGHGH